MHLVWSGGIQVTNGVKIQNCTHINFSCVYDTYTLEHCEAVVTCIRNLHFRAKIERKNMLNPLNHRRDSLWLASIKHEESTTRRSYKRRKTQIILNELKDI